MSSTISELQTIAACQYGASTIIPTDFWEFVIIKTTWNRCGHITYWEIRIEDRIRFKELFFYQG